MNEEDQIAADFAPGYHDVPESVLTSPAPTYYPGADFDASQAFLHGQGSEDQQRLSEVQAAQDKIAKWLATFHGAEPDTVDSLRRRVDSGKISGSDYYAMTGRIYAGGTGDTATRDAQGRITGYTSPDGSGSALGGPSATPGLDALHEMQGGGFSFLPDSPTPVPRSVAATVGVPSPGTTMAADTLTFDTRLQSPNADSISPKADGTRRNVSANSRLAEAAWATGQKNANASIRANFKAAGLPDPTLGATVLNMPGGGTAVAPGNMGANPRGYPVLPGSVWR